MVPFQVMPPCATRGRPSLVHTFKPSFTYWFKLFGTFPLFNLLTLLTFIIMSHHRLHSHSSVILSVTVDFSLWFLQVDFDDGNCPTFYNQIKGIHNVFKAVHHLFPCESCTLTSSPPYSHTLHVWIQTQPTQTHTIEVLPQHFKAVTQSRQDLHYPLHQPPDCQTLCFCRGGGHTCWWSVTQLLWKGVLSLHMLLLLYSLVVR